MPTPTITTIEQAILDAITSLGVFATIESCGRSAIPDTYTWPAAFAYFDGDAETPDYAEAADTQVFQVVVQNINLAGEQLAALDAYVLIDLVRGAIRGKTLGLDEIEPFRCKSRRLTDYDDSDGMIEYTLTFETTWYR